MLNTTLALALLLGMADAFAQAQEQAYEPASRLGKKVGQWQTPEPNAGQQKGNTSVQALTKSVRSAIVKDKALSSYAHNVKVISSWHGTVTLKGHVSSAEEKRAVEMKAAEIAGPGNVNTEIFVAAQAEPDRAK